MVFTNASPPMQSGTTRLTYDSMFTVRIINNNRLLKYHPSNIAFVEGIIELHNTNCAA